MSLTKVSYSMINGAPINLLDKGAVMNDSSSTSKAANKAALLSALATKRPVYVPSGTLCCHIHIYHNLMARPNNPKETHHVNHQNHHH